MEDDDRKLGNVDLMGDKSPLDNTNPSQRRRTPLMISTQTQLLATADEDETTGLNIFESSANIFDSRDLTEGAQDPEVLETDRAHQRVVTAKGPDADYDEIGSHTFDS